MSLVSMDLSLLPMASSTAGITVPALPSTANICLANTALSAVEQFVPDVLKIEKETHRSQQQQEFHELHQLVQREIRSGAKYTNIVRSYTPYIIDGVRGDSSYVIPTVTVYSPEPLQLVQLSNPNDVSRVGVVVPYGKWLAPIDGESTITALRAAHERLGSVMDDFAVRLVIHHGIPISHARQYFRDLNSLGVRANAAVSIGMDTRDIGTRIAQAVVDSTGMPVNMQKRQLTARDPEVTTISALRGGIVTSALGMTGLGFGLRPINTAIEEVDQVALESEVVEAWSALYSEFRDAFKDRVSSVIASPVVLAALGGVVNTTITNKRSDRPAQSVAQMMRLLLEVNWSKEGTVSGGGADFPWDGIAGKVSERINRNGQLVRVFSFAGPKESGYSTFDALIDPRSAAGRRIRD